MITKEQIGKIQICFGIILLIITIVGTQMIIQKGFDDLYKTLSMFNDIRESIEDETGENTQMIHSSTLLLLGSVYITSLYIFCLGVLILVALSAILILQGLANMAEK